MTFEQAYKLYRAEKIKSLGWLSISQANSLARKILDEGKSCNYIEDYVVVEVEDGKVILDKIGTENLSVRCFDESGKIIH